MSAFPSKAAGERLQALLKTMGIAKVVIRYSGSGDSGSIESAECQDAAGQEVPIDHISIAWVERNGSSTWDAHARKWVQHIGKEKVTPLDDVLKDVCGNALQDTGLDWYNNDGGQGELLMDFSAAEPEITLEVGINVITTADHTFKVSTGGDVECTHAPENDDAS